MTAGAIAAVLKTNKAVWTDEDQPVYVLSTARILETGTIAIFYIIPDYTSTTIAADPDINL